MSRSFNILSEEYRPMVVAYLEVLLKDEHLAQDVAQETFVSAYEALARFEDGEDFGKWLRGIARNKALMHWRSMKRRPLVVDSRVIEGVEEAFSELDRKVEGGDWWEQRKEALGDCLGGLSRHLREAIEEVYFNDRTIDETANSLGVKRSAVGQRLSRARNGLRECLKLKLRKA